MNLSPISIPEPGTGEGWRQAAGWARIAHAIPEVPPHAARAPRIMSDREYPPRPIVGIGVVVLKQNQVLLIRRAKPPNLGSWSLPGGAQELGETAEQAARRELMEETGITVGPLHLAAVVDNIRPDSAGRVRFHYTIIDFAAAWAAGDPRAGSDAGEAVWAPLDGLERFDLWDEAHRVIGRARELLATGSTRHPPRSSAP